MMIPLTNAHGKNTFGLHVNMIWCAERDAANPLITRVITTINGPKGCVAYEVMESPEDVMTMMAKAVDKEPIASLRTPTSAVVS